MIRIESGFPVATWTDRFVRSAQNNMERKPYYDAEPRRRNETAPRPQGSVRRAAPANAYSRSSSERRAPHGEALRRRAPQASRPHGPSAPPRRRKKDPAAVILPVLMVLAVVAIAVYVGVAWFTSAINNSTYCDNIYINGISVTSCTRDEAPEYVNDILLQQLSQVYTLTWEDQSWSFCALDFNAEIDTSSFFDRAWNLGHVGNIFNRQRDIRSLKNNPVYFDASIQYDETLIDALIESMYQALYREPVNAEVIMDMDKPQLIGTSSEGQELDRGAAKEQIISLIETGEGSTLLPVMTLEPDFSTELAQSGLEMIVEYKTDVSARDYNSRFNVRKALQNFNMRVSPGETIDFNAVVGPRSEARGYRSATEYLGNTTTKGFGGGVCQASTTLYGALLKAGITIIERKPHSMTVAYVDPSLDAAVTDTGNKNLVFRNDTGNPIFIYTEVTKEEACVRIYGVRPAYRYELLSVIESQDTAAVRTAYVDDVDGKHVYYRTDPPKLYKKGHSACTSNGYLIAYDWETGEEVSRQWLSHDIYESGTDIYWRGVHTAGEESGLTSTAATDTANASGDLAALTGN